MNGKVSLADVFGQELASHLIRGHTPTIAKLRDLKKGFEVQLEYRESFNAALVLERLQKKYDDMLAIPEYDPKKRRFIKLDKEICQIGMQNNVMFKTKPETFEQLLHFLIRHYLKFGNDIHSYAQGKVKGNLQRFYNTLIRQYDIQTRIKDYRRMSTITLARIAQCRPDIVMEMQTIHNLTNNAVRYGIPAQIPIGFQIQNYAKLCPCQELLYIAYVVYLKIDEVINKNTNAVEHRFKRIKNNVHKDYLTEQYTFEERKRFHANASLYIPETNEFPPIVYDAVRFCIKFLKEQNVNPDPLDKVNCMHRVPQHKWNIFVFKGIPSWVDNKTLWDSVEVDQNN